MSKCATEWAKRDPDGLIKAMNKNKEVAALINKAKPHALKGFMGALGRDLISPFGWLGGEIVFSTMFSVAAEASGKTPLEALDEGVLWFLPKGVIDARKKALFGYEGLPTSKRFKMEGYAQGYTADQIEDMKNYLDMEDSDRKYWAATDKRKNFETMRFDSETGKKRVLDKIDAAIEKHRTASTDSVLQIYERNTGLQTDGTPTKKDMNMEELRGFVDKTTADNLWDVQQQYAVDYINKAKQLKVNDLYAQREDKTADWLFKEGQKKIFGGYWGERKDGHMQLPFDMGTAGEIATSITNPFDRFYSRSPVPPDKSLPWGFRQGWNKVLDLYNLLPHASQEEKEAYARSIGRDDLFKKERVYHHPDSRLGTSLSYDQLQEVYPDYFSGAGGGIATLHPRRPKALPPTSGPDSQGLAYLNNYATKRTE